MKRSSKDLTLFILASACLGITLGIDTSFFNNYLSDVFNITVFQRTLLEFPRELPGFLVVFVSGMLIAFGDVRIAAIANIIAALGMLGLGYLSPEFAVMVGWMTLYSMGQHLYMPVANSIGMHLADDHNIGKVLGRINAVNTAAFLVTSVLIAILFRFIKIPYHMAFTVSAIGFIGAAICISMMSSHNNPKPSRALLFNKRYSLFYFLSVLFGARKQIFLTFGPWVLIKVFSQGVSTFAAIGFFTALIGVFFKPYMGHLIDTKGERFALRLEAVFLILICLGYAFAEMFFGKTPTALFIVAGCYVLDQVLSAAGMARATYIKKIAPSSNEISPTLSMGITIDHAVSMVIPWIGGLVWQSFGYPVVFLGGALIAFTNLIAAGSIKIPTKSL